MDLPSGIYSIRGEKMDIGVLEMREFSWPGSTTALGKDTIILSFTDVFV